MTTPARPSGHYPYQVCFGAFDPVLDDFDRRRVIHQLPFAHVMLAGLFEDEEGGTTTYMRTIEAHSSSFCMIFDRRAGEDIGVFHPAMRQMFRGSGAYTRLEDRVRFFSMNEDGLTGVDIVVSPGALSIDEPGFARLHGERTGLGFNFFAPQANDDIYRAAVAYDAAGELFGRRVKGFLTWQAIHAMPGEHFGYSRIVPKVIHAMAMGVSRYDDGSTEIVHISAGRNGWGYLSATSGGRVTAFARQVSCELDLDAQDYPARVSFATEAGDWIWEAAPGNGFAPAREIKVPYSYGVGTLKRAGERRALLPNSLTGLEANPKTWWRPRPMDREEIKRRLIAGEIGLDLFADDAVIWQNIGGGAMRDPASLDEAFAALAGRVKGIDFSEARAFDSGDRIILQRVNRVTLVDGSEVRVPVCLIATIERGKVARLDEYVTESRLAALFTE